MGGFDGGESQLLFSSPLWLMQGHADTSVPQDRFRAGAVTWKPRGEEKQLLGLKDSPGWRRISSFGSAE